MKAFMYLMMAALDLERRFKNLKNIHT